MGMGKPFPPSLPDPENYKVEFDGENDVLHPFNWKLSTK
jgi:DHA1 family multidrug resistance protein-like MFS transporter